MLDTLGLDQAWVVGHSWGGHLALYRLASQPERVTGVPVDSSTETAKPVAGARVVIVDGSGHFPWVECPDAFREAVAGFLSCLSDF